ncbi:MAG TPA: glucoamylase family protein, partial [Candidatus Limnocylindrales bacterium]
LSHDLFEGVFARAGLVTDIELFDEFPSHYLEAAARQHRWARGDWQLLPWIVGRARDATGQRRPRLPVIGLWKMIDNLRRTASAPLSVATLGVAWLVPTVPALTWTALVVASIVIPELIPVLTGLLPRRQGISRRSHLRAVGGDISLAAVHVGLGLTFLADQAWLMADAIVRALTRLTITHRRLLEWTTAAQAKANADRGTAGFYRRMAGGVGLAVALGAAVLAFRPESTWLAAPFVALWLVAPVAASLVSRPPLRSGRTALSPGDTEALRLIGRGTWRFFEAFVGPEDHSLPPDNFQDDPKPVVAHRTSPTNIGMYLLATVTARDLGWIGTCDMVERLEATLASIEELQRFRGHLYNWYDTRTLEPLGDRYVSSVDSGNLAGHLLAVSSACLDIVDRPLPIDAAVAGIRDALALVGEAARQDGDAGRSQTLTRRNLDEALADLVPQPDGTASPESWAGRLGELAERTRTLVDIATVLTSERGGVPDHEIVVWAEAARATVESHRRDVAETRGSTSTPAAGTDPAVPTEAGRDAGSAFSVTMERRLQAVATHARRLFGEMDFSFLFDPTRKLLSIGYSVTTGTLDPSCYDLLASECRLGSFLAIAKGDVDADHWFRLGRALTPVGRGSALISWSGSMFEYLMPALVMRAHPLSLMDQTYRLVVARQISYGTSKGVPWGVSESAYNARDLDQTSQYSSFGIPGLGLKRGLSENLVIAPYATGLAAMVDPEAAIRNFERLGRAGARGPYGFR